MASLNKVMLIGNLGRDPESRFTQDGKAVCNINIATTSGSRDNQVTEWHRIVCWEKLAELAGQYLTKGSAVYIEGRIQTRTWEDKEGQKRESKDIVATHLVFLGSKNQDGDGGSQHSGGGGGHSGGGQRQQPQGGAQQQRQQGSQQSGQRQGSSGAGYGGGQPRNNVSEQWGGDLPNQPSGSSGYNFPDEDDIPF